MEHDWVINNFSSLRHKCLSDAFDALAYKWKVIMYPLGNGDAALDQLSLFLGVADAKKLPPGWSKLARFRLQIVNHLNPAKTISKEVTHKFNATNSDYGWRSFVDLSSLHDPQAGFIKNDQVVIKASVMEVDRKAEAAAQAKTVAKQRAPKEDTAKNTSKSHPKCLRRDDGHDNPYDALLEILYHISSFRKLVCSRPYGSNTVITTLQRIFYQMQLGSQPIELLMHRANLVTAKSTLYDTDWLISSLLSNLAPAIEHGGRALFLEPAHIVCELTPHNVLEGLKRHFSNKPFLVDNVLLPSFLRAYITAKSVPPDKKAVFPLSLPLSKFAPQKDFENTAYYLFAIEVGDGNDHFYSYVKPYGNQAWFKIDGDSVETKVQINNAHSTITFYGEIHERPPNYEDLLFYIRDTDVASLADVPASHYSVALKKGMRDLVEEYDPYILLKVFVDGDVTCFFGLVHDDHPVREYEVKCTTTLKEFKSTVAADMGIPVDHQLYWITEAEDDGQKRPQRAIPPVDEEFRM